MGHEEIEIPWLSFCMSTYKRPVLLKQQLELILKQSFQNFEIVISDNDPDNSAGDVIKAINDHRLKYFPNLENIGTVKSFNKSIERATAEYVIMITDDDPVTEDVVEYFHEIINQYSGYGIYIGCSRACKEAGIVEVFDNQKFIFQLLHPGLTTNLLWSSCVLEKKLLLEIGGLPDYEGLHLADHAMMVFCGNRNGGVIINKMFSHLTSHDNNFSKSNINFYYPACIHFYNLIIASVKKEAYIMNGENALLKHLERWFITGMFSLRKYFTYQNKRKDTIKQINFESGRILELPFMRHLKYKYYLKLMIFNLKRPLYLVNILR